MLKAVLFDLDDTLIDWSQVENDWDERDQMYSRGVFDYVCAEVQSLESFDSFLAAFRKALRSAWEHGRGSLRSPHLGRVLNDTLEAVGVPASRIDQTACLEAYGWTAAPGLVPFPDVPPLLQLLCDQGVRIGIVTNAHMPMWLRDRELEMLDILDYFPDCRLSAADVGYLKPHPNIFQLALECVDASPEETVFVGDNPIADVAGAQGAGLKAVLRTRPVGTSLLSGIIAPDSALDSLEGLPLLLDDWYPGWR
jgi:HAD superfamily hydrolase (TIGR01509 family)